MFHCFFSMLNFYQFGTLDGNVQPGGNIGNEDEVAWVGPDELRDGCRGGLHLGSAAKPEPIVWMLLEEVDQIMPVISGSNQILFDSSFFNILGRIKVQYVFNSNIRCSRFNYH